MGWRRPSAPGASEDDADLDIAMLLQHVDADVVFVSSKQALDAVLPDRERTDPQSPNVVRQAGPAQHDLRPFGIEVDAEGGAASPNI
jgi:hypothetical protein